MKKQEEQIKYEIGDFEFHCHMWNIVPGGSGKGICLLRTIVDAIQSDNYSRPGNILPSFLITGVGKGLASKAMINSLAITDIRECHAKYFDNGIHSYEFFWDSLDNTAHVITDIDQLSGRTEPTLWKYLNNRECSYYNNLSKTYDRIVHCNGLIIMTCNDLALISDTIINATDHIIRLQPLNLDQMEAVIHQRLVFCKIDYSGDEVLRAVIGVGNSKIDLIIDFLKICILMMKAELKDCLTMEIVNRARQLDQFYVPPTPPAPVSDIPF